MINQQKPRPLIPFHHYKELQFHATVRDEGVRRIAARAHGLPPEAQQKVLDRIDELRRAEGLDT